MRLKLVGCLSTAFIYCISINSVAAINVISKQDSQSTQTIASNPLRIIEREQRRLERNQRRREREQRIELQRQQRELRQLQRQQELEQRQRELEAARREATEQQRIEAERRRQYFESLSPQEREAYLAEQRARRAQQADRSAALLLLMLGAFSAGSGSPQQGNGRWATCDMPGGTYDIYVRAGESIPSGCYEK